MYFYIVYNDSWKYLNSRHRRFYMLLSLLFEMNNFIYIYYKTLDCLAKLCSSNRDKFTTYIFKVMPFTCLNVFSFTGCAMR